MSYLKDREIWLSSVPTGNPPAGYVWVFIQNGVFVVRDSNGLDKIMASTAGSITTAATASYVQYTNVANKPTLVSGSAQVSFTGIINKPTLVSGSAQITYSGVSGKPEGIVSSSVQVKGYNVFATTGSNQFNGSQAITGSLTVTGQVVAQTLNVQQVTSSIVYSSGSNIFGNNSGNKHQFTGSVAVTGSLTVAGALSGTSATFSGNVEVGSTGNDFRYYSTSSVSGNPVLVLKSPSAGVLSIASEIIGDANVNSNSLSFRVSNSSNGRFNALTIAPTGAATFSNWVNVGYDSNNRSILKLTSNAANRMAAIRFDGNNAESGYIGYEGGSEILSGGVQGDLVIRNVLASKDIILATNNGNVGIDTPSPTDKLVVSNGGANTLHFDVEFSGGASTIYSYNRSTNAYTNLQLQGLNTIFKQGATDSMRITSGGDVFINNSSGVALNGLTNKLSVSSTTYNLFDISRFSDNAFGPNFYLVKSRNGSIGGNTIVANGDNLGNINWVGANGTGFTDAASIKAEVDGTPGASDMPGRLVFSTTADGANSVTERMRISSGGSVSIADGTFTVSQSSATRVVQLLGNGNNQGTAHNYKVVRHFPVVGFGNKLTIPFISQENLNSTTVVKIMGHSARFNSRAPLGFSAYFAVGHLSVLSDLTAWEVNGNISSIGYGGGMNVEINFTTAYTSAEANGLFITIEYMTNAAGYSINVAGITMN
jgi:hypothetical protein